MKLSFRLFLGLGVFLVAAAIVYGLHSHEYEGLVLSLTVAAGALLIGAYGVALVRRTRAELARAAADASPVDAGEPHVGPTIWPLAFAVAAVGLVVGAVANRWALVPGGIVFVAASVGWVLDVHHQWREHASGHSPAAHSAAVHSAGERGAVPSQPGGDGGDSSARAGGGASAGGDAAPSGSAK